MKRKFIVYHENGYDEDAMKVKYEEVKTFKNANEVLAFAMDNKNQRMYGSMIIHRKDPDGTVYEYDERQDCWEQINNSATLYNGDCLKVMQDIPDRSIDLVLCDPPLWKNPKQVGLNYTS